MRPRRLARALSPKLNPGGYMAAAGAIYAAGVMVLNAAHGHGPISVPVIVAAVAAITSLLSRHVVTPVADPRTSDGTQLIPVTQVATFRSTASLGSPFPVDLMPGEQIVQKPGGLGS
jgi:hypothetical protein